MLYFLSPGAGCGMSRLPKSDVSSAGIRRIRWSRSEPDNLANFFA